MQADAQPLAQESAGEALWRQAIMRSDQSRRGIADVNMAGRIASPAFDAREIVGIGSPVVASAWLAFFVIAAVHFLAFGN